MKIFVKVSLFLKPLHTSEFENRGQKHGDFENFVSVESEEYD